MPTLQEWLDDDTARRNIFAVVTVYDVVGAQDIVLYLSNCHYITDDSVTVFDPIISGNFSISESLSLNRGYSISYGDLEVFNNGDYDIWLDTSKYIWVNRSIKIYVGDSRWSCANAAAISSTFHMIFDGLVHDIDCKSIDKLNIKVRDKQEQLNTPVFEELMDTTGVWNGEQPNKDEVKPLVFGEVHNIEPVLIDPSTLKYRFSVLTSEQIIEIRDNGVPIYNSTLTSGATIDLTNGTFTLTHPAVGQITASVQGRKRSVDLSTGTFSNTYVNTVPNIIAVLCVEYGKVGVTNLSISDIDLTSFEAIEIDAPYAVGIYLYGQKHNLIDVCKQLADSIGAQIFFNRQGKLQLIRLGTYVTSGNPLMNISEDDIVRNTLSISERNIPQASYKLAYCKNWTVQSGIVTGIPEEHKEMFASEWYYSTYTDTAVKTAYKLNSEVEAVETLLLSKLDADNEAARLNNFFKNTKTVYKFTGKARTLSLTVGQEVKLFHHRFNLWNSGNGTSGQVVSVSPDWYKGTNNIEVQI